MGSSRRHRDKDTKDKHKSRSRSKSKDRERYEKSGKSERSLRSSHRHKESSSGSRKRQRGDSTDEERVDRSDKKLKVKEVLEVSKSSNSSVNKNVKLDQKSSDDNDRTHRRDGHQSKEDLVKTDGSNTESLSVEETNKLRLKLGLKPLDLGQNGDKEGENTEAKTEQTEVFVKTEKISDKIEAQKMKEKIETRRERRRIANKLKRVKGLAESDSEEDVSAWVLKNKSMAEEKAKALKRAELLEEMDKEFSISSIIDEEIQRKRDKAYTSRHLKGLTVGHNTDEFKEGKQLVLTLKDRDVLNEDEDVLENVNLVDDQKANKNIENKSKRPEYKPYDEPELDEFGILKPKSLLSKYDEEIDGVKKESFKLGISSNKANDIEMIRMKLKQEEGRISLIGSNPKIVSEYYTEEEMIRFKKPKKIKKELRKKSKKSNLKDDTFEDMTSSADHGSRKTRSQDNTDEDVKPKIKEIKSEIKSEFVPKNNLLLESMDIDDAFDPMDEDLSGIVLEEDELDKELQTALHKARKLKQRDNSESTTGAASIVKVAQTVRTLNVTNDNSNDSSEPFVVNNIVMNSTAEFCRNLGDIPTYGLAGNRDDEEELMDLEREINEERVNDSQPNRGQWNEVEVTEEDVAQDLNDIEGQPILEEEPDLHKGLAGALQLAMKKGYLDKEVKKQGGSQRQSLLEAQSYTIEEKFYEDDKIGRRERYSGPVSDFREKYDYKPEIKLDYVDEKGRALDPKEAFRVLSHKFHGKGPSKNKIDKRMKKLDQESKLRQMSSVDTPLNTLKMLTEKQKEFKTPYIVLTGGQKTAIQTSISKKK